MPPSVQGLELFAACSGTTESPRSGWSTRWNSRAATFMGLSQHRLSTALRMRTTAQTIRAGRLRARRIAPRAPWALTVLLGLACTAAALPADTNLTVQALPALEL